MAIRQIAAPSWKTATWSCYCDFCNNQLKKTAQDPGDASENARKEGYTTVKGNRVEQPLKWACLSCSTKSMSNGKGVS